MYKVFILLARMSSISNPISVCVNQVNDQNKFWNWAADEVVIFEVEAYTRKCLMEKKHDIFHEPCRTLTKCKKYYKLVHKVELSHIQVDLRILASDDILLLTCRLGQGWTFLIRSTFRQFFLQIFQNHSSCSILGAGDIHNQSLWQATLLNMPCGTQVHTGMIICHKLWELYWQVSSKTPFM
jgi:hypothetical protein